MFFAFIEVKIKIHSLPKNHHSLPNIIYMIHDTYSFAAETKIFTIWNESDYFNEELQARTVSRSCYGLTNGSSTEKR